MAEDGILSSSDHGSSTRNTNRNNNGERLSSMNSIDSRRWVFQDDDNSDFDFDDGDDENDDDVHDDDDDFTTVNNDSEEEDSLYQKLIRTGPWIDSFGVEALEVPGAHRNDFEVSQAMSTNYLNVRLSSTSKEAVQCMDNGHQTCVLVIDNEEHLEEILTYGDIKCGMMREYDEIEGASSTPDFGECLVSSVCTRGISYRRRKRGLNVLSRYGFGNC